MIFERKFSRIVHTGLCGFFIFILFLPLYVQAVDRYLPMVIAVYPHDTKAFTQGLYIEDETLYESTGNYGQSSLRKLNLKTNQLIEEVKLPPQLFGEGIAPFRGGLIQLTWREGTALVYSLKPLKQIGQIPFEGEGWGACSDEKYLYTTDGTEYIKARNPETLAVERMIKVQVDGTPVQRLNDFTCVDDRFYANVWKMDLILIINKESGAVEGVVDTRNLLTKQEKEALKSESVLNGIAYRNQTQTFFLTGKNWPHLYEVKFIKVP